MWRDEQVLFDSRVEAAPAADGVSFASMLPAGPAQIQTWFYDLDRQAITGAYYVYVNGPAPRRPPLLKPEQVPATALLRAGEINGLRTTIPLPD